ncbi:MAG TPA: cyanophycin synthetase, partial [Ktedonobacterales bacterium]
PGRMERVDCGQPFTVIVDYAHNPDSLGQVLRLLRPLTPGRLIAVFGSAGERDTQKRPQQGAISARLADLTFLTDEDCREEDPQQILHEIAAGALEAGATAGKNLWLIVDRRQAIAAAFDAARPGDTVLLAGKGHEHSIIVGRESLPWDEREVARELLRERWTSAGQA